MKKIALAVAAVLVLLVGYRWLFSAPDIRNAKPSGENIICFGDSLTAGTGAPEGADYPSQLSAIIGRPVINAGVPGDTTTRALERLDRDVLARSPRIVMITLGGNDLKNRVAKDTAFANLKQIVVRIQDRGALVIVGGLRFPLYDRGYAEGYRRLAEDTRSVLIDNIFEGIMGDRSLMSDPIHPNAAGYARMAQAFHRALKPYL